MDPGASLLAPLDLLAPARVAPGGRSVALVRPGGRGGPLIVATGVARRGGELAGRAGRLPPGLAVQPLLRPRLRRSRLPPLPLNASPLAPWLVRIWHGLLSLTASALHPRRG